MMPVQEPPLPQLLACPPKTAVRKRPLFTAEEAENLADTFKILASDTRLRLLHALVRAPELCVSDLADAVEMTPQAVSNQLQRMADRGIVATRRNGAKVFYHLVDPCIIKILDHGFCLSIESSNRTKS